MNKTMEDNKISVKEGERERGRGGGRVKAFIRLVDIESGEVMGQGEMTPATAKRLAKLYEAYGYYVRIA